MKENCADSQKWIFKDEKHLKDFPIDKFKSNNSCSWQLTFFSKENFMNDKMRSDECLYFYLKHSQSNVFFLHFTRRLRHPHQTCRTSNFWLNSLKSQNLGVQVAWAIKPTAYTHIQWKLNKQRYNSERMRDKDVKFVHIICIIIVVHNNGINLKILMGH